jgi:hypothetical protein
MEAQSLRPRPLPAQDLRRLGVPIERILLHDDDLLTEIGHGYPGLCDGLHADEDGHRWTDGVARLPESLNRPFAGAFTLELHLASRDLLYWVQPPMKTPRHFRQLKTGN